MPERPPWMARFWEPTGETFLTPEGYTGEHMHYVDRPASMFMPNEYVSVGDHGDTVGLLADGEYDEEFEGPLPAPLDADEVRMLIGWLTAWLEQQ